MSRQKHGGPLASLQPRLGGGLAPRSVHRLSAAGGHTGRVTGLQLRFPAAVLRKQADHFLSSDAVLPLLVLGPRGSAVTRTANLLRASHRVCCGEKREDPFWLRENDFGARAGLARRTLLAPLPSRGPLNYYKTFSRVRSTPKSSISLFDFCPSCLICVTASPALSLAFTAPPTPLCSRQEPFFIAHVTFKPKRK